MVKFLKYFIASFLGCIAALVALFFLMMGVVTAMASFGKVPVTVKDNTVLKIELDAPIAERAPEGTIPNFDYMNMQPRRTDGLNKILESIKTAGTDPKIKGIYLELSSIPAGMAAVEEIRNALLEFKKSEKFIIGYGISYSQKAYYLATVADKIYLHPEGDFLFKGMSSRIMFYKKALEKLDIEAQIIRHGKFKSAVEPFMLESMSKENREQTASYVGSIWHSLLTSISESRNLSESQLNAWIDKLEVYDAPSALDKGLIDGLKYEDEVLTELSEKTGAKSVDDLQIISLSKYERSKTSPAKSAPDKIAVVYAEGDIMPGEGSEGIMSETMSKAIRSARSDSTVKAIVFRINSGGGSALASDIISREVQLASQVKPVIASFGDVAASGGYYIATQADVIIADPTTITGSIGVFGLIPNLKGFMNNKLGLTYDAVNTNKHSDFISTMRPLSAEEEQLLQRQVERTYDTFITRVSTGRNMTKEAVDEIGQGRVWSAVDAKRIGLIDEFGGLTDAVRIAADKAGIADYEIVEFPKQTTSLLETLLASLTEDMKTRSVRRELGEFYPHYHQLKSIFDMQGVQTRMPYVVELY